LPVRHSEIKLDPALMFLEIPEFLQPFIVVCFGGQITVKPVVREVKLKVKNTAFPHLGYHAM
jgi:hypothetical protein